MLMLLVPGVGMGASLVTVGQSTAVFSFTVQFEAIKLDTTEFARFQKQDVQYSQTQPQDAQFVGM